MQTRSTKMKKNNEILKVKNLNVEFPIFGGILQREVSHVHAVKDLSLSVCQGETIGIVVIRAKRPFPGVNLAATAPLKYPGDASVQVKHHLF